VPGACGARAKVWRLYGARASHAPVSAWKRQIFQRTRLFSATGRNAKEGAGVPLYWRPQESGSDTMLNILYKAEEGKREKRKRAEVNNGLHCIIL
jgi:hypothetical protein